MITILLADDHPGIRRFCSQELRAEGYRVLLAQDGEEALSVVGENEVDLAILDAHMPVCSGFEAARHIKRANPQLPVILFTLDTDYERYRSEFVDRCVIKTGDLDELKEAIARALWGGSGCVASANRCSWEAVESPADSRLIPAR